MKTKLQRSGFTLVELLTVIAIIGILAAILIPTVSRMRAQANATACMSNMRQIGLAIRLYMNDNKQRIPPKGITSTTRWIHSLNPYLPLRRDSDAYANSMFHCASTSPEAYASKNSSGLYGINPNFSKGDSLADPTNVDSRTIVDPERKILIAEKAYTLMSTDSAAGPEFDPAAAYPTNRRGMAFNHGSPGDPEAGRGICYTLFMDMSVRALTEWPGAAAFKVDTTP